MFNLMSGSTMYTATAVLLAVQDGLLDLDEPLTSDLPGFGVHSTWESGPERRMTLRVLLSHRSGLTHEAPRGSNVDSSDRSFDDHCRSISDTWLLFPVGHHAEYGNLAFDLAAWTVACWTQPCSRRCTRYLGDVLANASGSGSGSASLPAPGVAGPSKATVAAGSGSCATWGGTRSRASGWPCCSTRTTTRCRRRWRPRSGSS